jgi:signal peptidase II
VIALLIRKAQERLLIVSFSLIAGGAIGNLVDRIRFGEVVDFINVYIWSKVAFLNPWPTFNIADSAISVGVALLVLDMFKKRKQRGGGR